ncbi:MAG: hypothetical protein WA783_15470 [Phormidesmis sp.]
MEKPVDPLIGRAAELNEYATSDLSVEENLASGASVDDLVAAGVLYDDYDPDNNPAYSFTPRPTEAEMAAQREAATKKPPMSDAEFKALLESSSRYSRLAEEHRKETNRRATWT